jgi:hypothetical protein
MYDTLVEYDFTSAFQDADRLVIDGVMHCSILRVIESITGKVAKTIWNALKANNSDDVSGFKMAALRKGSHTPVADAELMVKIIHLLPGKRARAFCMQVGKRFLRTLNPTPEFLEELEGRMLALEQGRTSADGYLVPFGPRAPRGYNECSFYVRMCLPEAHRTPTVHPKQLTMGVHKFGITCNMQSRHTEYGADNGFMAFKFDCFTRGEAMVVEEFMKNEYATVTVWNSREYLDSAMTASKLQVEHQPGSYESYMQVATRLYVQMVERLHLNYPKYAGMYGTLYDVVEAMQTVVNLDTDSHENQTSIRFPAKMITPELAADLGFRRPSVVWEQPGFEPIKVKSKSNGEVVSRDLISGEEETFGSVSAAARSIGYTEKSLKRCVDARRQMAGKHWRTPGQPFWIPPQGMHIDLAGREGSLRYVRGVDSHGVVRVYENATVAARHQPPLTAKPVTSSANNGVPYKGVQWSWVADTELSAMSDTHTDIDTAARVTLITLPARSTADGRGGGDVIQRDIWTGEEIVFSSASKAARKNAMPASPGFNTTIAAKMMKHEVVDKTRPVNGRTFRSANATERWQVPHYYKRNPSNVYENWPTADNKPWFVTTDEDGKIIALYETKKCAAEIEGLSYDGIKTAFDTGLLKYGRLWRQAEPGEYGVFVPCEPPVAEDSGEDSSDDESD